MFVDLEISKYGLLKRLVAQEQLRIVLMLSTPRTRSTALQIACTQAVEIDTQISAPFSNQQYGPISFYHYEKSLQPGKNLRPFEEGCNKIYERYVEVSANHKRAVTGILTYEALSRLLDDEMHKLLQLTREVIIPIRDPYRQFVSFLVQYFHDYFTTASDKYLKASQVLDLISKLKKKTAQECDQLWDEYITKEAVAKSVKKTPETVNGEDILAVLNQMIPFVNSELDIIWSNLEHCLDIVSKSEFSHHTIAIVDGEDFVEHSSEILSNICQKFKLSYSNKMTDDWQKGSGSNFKSGHPTKDRLMGWSAPAKESSSIHKNNDSVDVTPKIQDFPVELHTTLNKAWNVYRECLMRTEFIRITQPPIIPIPTCNESKKPKRDKSPEPDKCIEPSTAQLLIAARREYASSESDKKRKGNEPVVTEDATQGASSELLSGKRPRHLSKQQ